MSRILVVDDEHLNRALIEAILVPEGHELVFAESGEEALASARAGDIDLVLLDVMMPGIDGIEACRRIREELGERLLPIVILSALADTESRTRGKEAGADDFLTKPVHEDELLARVRNLLKARAHYTATQANSAERHRVLFAVSPMPQFMFDPKTLQFLEVNEALVALLGYTREELLGMRVAELKDPAQVPGLIERMTTVVAGMTRKVGVQRYTRKDGNYVELDITSSSSELDGRLVVVAACIDVTYARRVEEQLRQAAKMEAIGQLAGGVAHDFNNILAAILANVELARDTLGDRHPVALEIGEIEKASHRAVQLTRQLLTFSRKEQREVKPLGLASVVRQVEKMLARLVGENVQIATVTEPALGTIEADGGQLEQLIVNLVVNARDAMPDGGQITLETANVELDQTGSSQVGVAPGRYVMLAVSDTGCGMDAATQARIFEPFFTTKEVGKGTGLGLATVFGIVKQSEGGVSVYSEVGRGSTFKLYFPRVDRMRKPTLEPGARTRFALGSGTVLLVEDDEMLRSVIRRQLTAWGYSLLEARDAGTALAIVKSRREPIDLLFTDLVMPGVDGRALAREVIAEHPSIKVLFMSGYTEHAAVRTATLGPTDHFIPKPFTGTMLSHAILRALGLTSQER